MLCPCYVDIIRQKKHIYLFITFFMYNYVGARGGAVGWGTALQTGRSRVRFPMVSLT